MGAKITAELMSVTCSRDGSVTGSYSTTIPLNIAPDIAWNIIDDMTVKDFTEYPTCITKDIAQDRYCFSVNCGDNPPLNINYEISNDEKE